MLADAPPAAIAIRIHAILFCALLYDVDQMTGKNNKACSALASLFPKPEDVLALAPEDFGALSLNLCRHFWLEA